MAHSNSRKIYVLYGSQTGNGESIAREVADKLVANHKDVPFVSIQIYTLNAAKDKGIDLAQSLLLIICSTTGNGDSPENAENWWRTVKLRSAVRECLLYTTPPLIISLRALSST